MPYIKEERRTAIDSAVLELNHYIDGPGELNYAITKLCLKYLEEGVFGYSTLSAVRAVLHDVHDEFYRRVMVPYEEKKREENGDVYDL